MKRVAGIICALLLALPTAYAAPDWQTPAEAAHYATTPGYAETLAFLQRLQHAAPAQLHITTFGRSAAGRPLTVVIASRAGHFTPAAARAAGDAVVLVQAGIHAGEIAGKDAGLALLRDALVAGKASPLPAHVTLVFIPVFNVDGAANRSLYHRINQNGPSEQGFRGTAQYLNLNRDYIKADTPEMRAWLRLWQHWLPDFLVDLHATDGADYPYDLTWYTEEPRKLDAAVNAWQQATLARVMPRYQQRGHLATSYLNFVDGRDPRKGIENFGSGPRFSTGYAALQNRPALLIEMHMLKPYRVRVEGDTDLLQLLLADVGAHAAELRRAVATADAATIKRAAKPDARVALTWRNAGTTTPFRFKGYAWTLTPSAISGAPWIRYDRTRPIDLTIPNADRLLPALTATVPAAYAIPPAWTVAIDRLRAHGIAFRTLPQGVTVTAMRDQLDAPTWATRPFEGHLMLRDFELSAQRAQLTLPAGTVIVPLAQRAANVAIELLEPQATDSLLHWGYFDAIFERKEYAEPRVAEDLARRMLKADPALQASFDAKLTGDAAFKANPRARLDWFFRRSPWYAAQGVGAYPVVRLDAAALRTTEAAAKTAP